MPTGVSVGILLIAILALAGCLTLALKYRRVRQQFGGIIDITSAVDKAKAELALLTAQGVAATEENARRRGELNAEYERLKSEYDRLKHEVSLLEENLEDISFGVYKPHYDFQTSEEYKRKLNEIWQCQRQMVREGKAAYCPVEWTVGGSKREGVRMQKQQSKLMLRAFNGECDAAVAKVAWNNVTRMEERIRKTFEQVGELGGVMQISMSPQYLDLKLAELRLEYELEEKKHAEAEEQRRIKEQMREEERAQKELQKAKEEAEAEEVRYEKALEKARAEVAKAKGEQLEKLNTKIEELQSQLEEAQRKRERATSMAELTKSGHVYLISNIGSFGEDVFKIGMTRRLDPMERVKELGDASVPFDFDVHAMIYSDDAPGLENALHKHFDRKRVNLVNTRKEFFQVTVAELEHFVQSRGHKAEVTRLAEARQYRETVALREKARNTTQAPASAVPSFPQGLETTS